MAGQDHAPAGLSLLLGQKPQARPRLPNLCTAGINVCRDVDPLHIYQFLSSPSHCTSMMSPTASRHVASGRFLFRDAGMCALPVTTSGGGTGRAVLAGTTCVAGEQTGACFNSARRSRRSARGAAAVVAGTGAGGASDVVRGLTRAQVFRGRSGAGAAAPEIGGKNDDHWPEPAIFVDFMQDIGPPGPVHVVNFLLTPCANNTRTDIHRHRVLPYKKTAGFF